MRGADNPNAELAEASKVTRGGQMLAEGGGLDLARQVHALFRRARADGEGAIADYVQSTILMASLPVAFAQIVPPAMERQVEHCFAKGLKVWKQLAS